MSGRGEYVAQKRAFTAALVAVVVGGTILLTQNAQAEPVEVSDIRSGASVAMSVSRDRQLFPAQCANVHWKLVRAVYLNGVGTVGADEQGACTVSGTVTPSVEFTDDTSRTYSVSQEALYRQPLIVAGWVLTC